MSENNSDAPIHKPQFVLTVLSKVRLTTDNYEEISNAIGERISLNERSTFDNITHTHRHIFNFSPVELEASKRRIQELARRHKSDLTIFFDPQPTFGIRRLQEQIQRALDTIIGIILPTQATIIFETSDEQQVKDIRKSLGDVFFNGNNTVPNLKNLKRSGNWHKATFKVSEPIKFRSNFELFKRHNRGLTVFEDVTRKSLRSYAPYAGFLGILLNIVQFRDSIWIYANQLIRTCSELIQG